MSGSPPTNPKGSPLFFILVLTGILLGGGVPSSFAQTPPDPARLAATEAFRTIQDRCPRLYERAPSPDDQVVIAEVFRKVDLAWKDSQVSYLQYWRGALAQCLGRTEWARTDLSAFIRSADSDPSLEALRTEAVRRLSRLDAPAAGTGPSSQWVAKPDRLEVALNYSAGIDFHQLDCTDDGTPATGQSINAACTGASTYTPARSIGGVPASLHSRLSLFPLVAFGPTVSLHLDLPLTAGLPDDRSPGSTLEFRVGAILRLLPSFSVGRRKAAFRAEGGVSIIRGSISPWAGNAKYVSDLGFLDAGTYSFSSVGAFGGVEGEVEISSRALLAWGGSVSLAVPVAGKELALTVPPSTAEKNGQEGVEIVPEPLSAHRWDAAARVSLLFTGLSANIAAGPSLDLGFHQVSLEHPDDPSDVWRVSLPEEEAGDRDERKVYSTRRRELQLRIGIDIRFGTRK